MLELDFLALFRCTVRDDFEGEMSRIIFACLYLLRFKALENPRLATTEQKVYTFDVSESTVFCLFVFVYVFFYLKGLFLLSSNFFFQKYFTRCCFIKLS